MTATTLDLALYAGALFVLFLTPGPVWMATIARSMSGGFQATWPLALGVAVGDIVWPFVAILGITWIAAEFETLMAVLRYGAALVFVAMGWMLIRHADKGISENRSLTRPGRWAGFLAGVAVILSNPKAILFYMGVLPGFFDLTGMTRVDMAAILALSFSVPLVGNLAFAVFVDRMRGFVTSPTGLRKLNQSAGFLLICVGVVIPFT